MPLFADEPFNPPVVLTPAESDTVESQAVVWGDYDNDGWVDLYITRGHSTFGTSYKNLLFRNISGVLQIQNLGFTDTVKTSAAASWGDYNNDGYLDLYVANAQDGPYGSKWRNSLYLNNGSGNFIDKTWDDATGPIVTDLEDSRHAAWGDYNGDGYPDMFVDTGKIAGGPGQEVNSFYENQGDGTFVKKTAAEIGNIVGTATDYQTFGAGLGWCDYNRDGFQDIFNASGYGTKSKLWENTGSASFTQALAGTFTNSSIMGVSWGDYNNDGKTDLYLAAIIDGFSGGLNALYINSSTPALSSFAAAPGSVGPIISDRYFSQGTAWADYDNDGDLDMYVANRAYLGPVNSQLYQNSGQTGGYTFTSITGSFVQLDPGDGSRIGEGRGVAWADMNNDGFMDLAVARYGRPLLYVNVGNGNHFVSINCRGTGSSNASGLGARVQVHANIPEQGGSIDQYREVSGETGAGGQNDLRAHFGLGSAAKIDSLKVEWPSGSINYLTDLPVDKFMVFTEGNHQVTATVIPQQHFIYLFGNSGAAVEFTDLSGSGTVGVNRQDSEPAAGSFSGASALAPDGTTVTPNVVSPERYWSITESGMTGNFTVTVYADITGLSGVMNPNRLVLVRRQNSSEAWQPLDTQILGNTLLAPNVTLFGEFAIASDNSDNSLPVELTAFAAVAKENQVVLSWTTQSEINNQGFIIERAADKNGPYQEIASYLYTGELRGQGSSNSATIYSFIDRDFLKGNSYYYRLSDVDFNGVKTILGTVKAVSVTTASEFRLYPNYPNPFNPATHVKIAVPAKAGQASRIELIIYNSLGKKVRTLYEGEIAPGEHVLEWDGKDRNGIMQTSGFYFLQLNGDGFEQVQKMLLMK